MGTLYRAYLLKEQLRAHTEASIYNACHAAMPGFVTAVYSHSSGGGKFLAIMEVNKPSAFDDGRARQAALVTLGVYAQLKTSSSSMKTSIPVTPTMCCGP